ncbi:MAG: nucleoside diphosphate kinase regulator [Pseudolabrys sp.]|nr:nucleoside diphosphate kinase regulator [Pseudolabrys sp.]
MTQAKQLPPIALSKSDRERLERLAEANSATLPRVSDYLAREVARAMLVSDDIAGRTFVSMGSSVTYRDNSSGKPRHITLVYPDMADIAAGKISVLTPIGAALIGMSVDQSIEWQTPSGDTRSLTVLAVGRMPAPAGLATQADSLVSS